jgi:tetratricopeptide (TPR) repeat protein
MRRVLAPLAVLLATLTAAVADPPVSISDLHARLEAAPDDAGAVRALGAALVERGLFDLLLGLLPPGGRSPAAEGEAAFWRGVALQARSQGEAALMAFEQAARLQPGAPRAMLALARHLARLDRPHRAERIARRAADLDASPEQRAEALALLGELRHRAGDPAQAERLFSEAVLADPANPAALVGHAVVLLSEGRGDEAEREARQVLETRPDHAAARYVVARVQVDRQQPAAALETLRDADEAGYAPSLLLRAMLRMNAGALELARQDLDQYQALAGVDARSQRLRGSLLLRLHEPAAAQVLGDAAARAPEDVQIAALLAAAHLLNGDMAAAADALDTPAGLQALAQMARQMPRSPLPPTLSGLIHHRRGESRAARADLEQALALDPAFAPAAQALNRLPGGGG